jgi:hypothetical protein
VKYRIGRTLKPSPRPYDTHVHEYMHACVNESTALWKQISRPDHLEQFMHQQEAQLVSTIVNYGMQTTEILNATCY